MSLKLWFKRAFWWNSRGLWYSTQLPCKQEWVLPRSPTIPKHSLIQVSPSFRSRKCVPESWIHCRYFQLKWTFSSFPAHTMLLSLTRKAEGSFVSLHYPLTMPEVTLVWLAPASGSYKGPSVGESAQGVFQSFLLHSTPGLWLFWVIL